MTDKHNLKPIHDLNTPTHSRTKRNARVYRLQPAKTVAGSAPAALPGPAATPAVCTQAELAAPAKAPWPRPAPQPLEARVAHEKIPKGLGPLTLALADAEVCDWYRFADRKAPSSHTGCCPSERSTGGVQRTGRIDRHGNAHLRTLLVEAVWRLARWNPAWHAYRKLAGRLNAAGKLPKRWAVALARQLAVDLWRVRTGRSTWAELGFREMT